MNLKCNPLYRVLPAFICLLAVFLLSPPDSSCGETEKTVGEILFSGDMTDSDAQKLKRAIYRDVKVTERVSDDCNRLIDESMTAIRSSGGKGFDFGSIISSARDCAGSGNQSIRKEPESSRMFIPLPAFSNPEWAERLLSFEGSLYAVKPAVKNGRHIGWPQAQSACWNDHRGRLVTIETAAEDAFIRNLVEKHGKAYIGLYREYALGGRKEPEWIRHVAAGKSGGVAGFSNWLDDEPSHKVKNSQTFSPYLNFWGVYDRQEASALKFWSRSPSFGWRVSHPGQLVEDPAVCFICEWDRAEWEDVTEISQLDRNETFSTAGGVTRVNGEAFRF